MSTATLKRLLGEGGAGIDDSMGFDNLYDVLKALAESAGDVINAYQATIATATIGGAVIHTANKLVSLRTSVGTCGTANSTTVQVHVNGVSKGELTTAHDETDGTKKSLELDVDLAVGDLVELVVSAAPTAGADLVATARALPITVES